MLTQFAKLSVNADGRYASDQELLFLHQYLQTIRLRLSAYLKIQAAEPEMVQQVLRQLKEIDPRLVQSDTIAAGNGDLTAKWQRDTVRVLRYAAIALLIDDPEFFKERLLLWFQTVMRAFKAERSCNATYVVMQAVIQNYLTPEEAQFFLPLLEMSRLTLGKVD